MPLGGSRPEADWKIPLAGRSPQAPPAFGAPVGGHDVSYRVGQVNILRRRGLTKEALQEIDNVIDTFPTAAEPLETKGDMLAESGNLALAAEYFQAALKREPGRTAAESKLARVTLLLSEQTQARLAAAGSQANPRTGPSTFAAVMASMTVPGWGQLLRRQYLKAVIIFSLFLIVNLVWYELPETQAFFKSLMALSPQPLGPASNAMSVFAFIIYTYSVIDAAIAPKRPSRF